MPSVSIRIMTYNHADIIGGTIESCLAQTFGDFDICIADDCSTDGTVEVIRGYQRRYPGKIKLFVQPVNVGQYSLAINGNAARDLCQGQYVAILDGDERMVETRLERQVRYLEENPDAIAVSHNKMAVDWASGEELPEHSQTLRQQAVTAKDLVLNGNIFHNCYMMRNVSLRADHSLKVMSDLEFTIRMAMEGRLGFQAEQLTMKLWHGNNITTGREKQFEEDLLLTLALVEHKYPELVRYVMDRRFRFYWSKLRQGERAYLGGLMHSKTLSLLARLAGRRWRQARRR